MVFVSIVWNYFENVPLDICHYINDFSSIGDVTLLRLDSHFSDFVNDVYTCNKITREWIPLKISVMEKLSKRDVLIITYRLSNPQIAYDPIQNRDISEYAKILKENIRNKFNPLYDCSPKYPIIHSTDHESESLELLKIIQHYFQFCIYEKVII